MPTSPITLPDMPVVEGLRFRSICGEEDADGVHAVRAGCIARDEVDLLSTCEGLPSLDEYREAFAEVAAGQDHNQRLVAQVNGQVVGYSLIEPWYEADGRWVYLILGWVLPDWRGRGIGTAMLRWGERTARQLAAAEHANERFEFAGNASSTEHDTTELLRHEGYYVGFTVLDMKLEMSAPPHVHPLPDGIEIRPALPEHYPLIARSISESYRNEFAGDRFRGESNEVDSVARLSASGHDPSLWQVAWDGDQVAGQVIPLIAKGRPEMYDVSIRPAWRRRGLARALLTRALYDLYERGYRVVRLHTTAEFPTRARDLYQSAGFRVVKQFPRYRKAP